MPPPHPSAPAPLRHAALLAALFAGVGVTLPFLPPYLAARGLGPEAVSAVLFAGSAVRLLAAPPVARAADASGDARRMLALLALAASAASLAWLAAHGLWALAAVQVAAAALSAALLPVAEGMAVSAGRRGLLDYPRVRAAGSAAFIAGSAAAGWLASRLGLEAVPWLLAAAFLASALAALALPRVAAAVVAPPRPAARRRDGGGDLAALLRAPGFRRLVAAGALVHGSHAAYYAFGSLHWLAAGHSATVVGLLWAWGVVAEVALFAAGRRFGDALGGARGMMLAAAALGAVRWAGTAATTWLPALVALQALHAASFGLYHLAAMRVLAEAAPEGRAGAAQSWYNVLGGGGPVALLVLACGPLWAALGAGPTFGLMAALCLAALPLAARMGRG